MKYIFTITILFILYLCSGCGCTTQHNIEIKADNNGTYIPVEINDTTIMMLWDTGSTTSYIHKDLADTLGLKYDTSKISMVFRFLEKDAYLSKMGRSARYHGDKVACRIGNSSYDFKVLICNHEDTKVRAILGDDFMNKFYYALHLTDQKLSLSTTPISFTDYEIADSVVFHDDATTSNHVYKIKIESDTLNLIMDSGMIVSDINNQSNSVVYRDIALSAQDSTGVVSKVFNDIRKRARVDISSYFQGKEIKSVYDSVFCVNSYKMMSYIPYLVDSSYKAGINGYIAYGFIARFDIVYYDPKKKSMTLYKIKDYNSIMQDVSMHEYFKGATEVKEW